MKIYVSGLNGEITGDYLAKIISVVNQGGHILILPDSSDLNERIPFVCLADLIVTVPEWETKQQSKREVEIARLLDKKIVFYSSLAHEL